MKLAHCLILLILIILLFPCITQGEQRFDLPDFSEYQKPHTSAPSTQNVLNEIRDMIVLVAALGLASFLALKYRSRRGIFLLMIFSLGYFGFYREGCVCPIGAIQNVTLALFDSSYAIPYVVLAFFLLPLIFTLLFGRGFCGAVCPLGAIQDVVLLKPLTVPAWLQQSLGLLAYVYLGAAVLFAATGSAFIICEYDPFVSFFRLSGSYNMLVLGFSFLIISMFVGRPYCRFLCPYGVLLRLLSRVSLWRVTVTPTDCVNCRLCEESCPFGAIETANIEQTHPRGHPDKRRLGILLVLVPIFVIAGGWLVSWLAVPFSRMHFTVRLAEQIAAEDAGKPVEIIEASKYFHEKASSSEVLIQRKQEIAEESRQIRRQFYWGGWLLGGFLGVVIGVKLVSLAVYRRREDYQADRAHCVACGRCFTYCPVEHVRQDPTKNVTIK
jgi:NosR/NirI family transcriptional regulator, nitrous oxide reductase regulator